MGIREWFNKQEARVTHDPNIQNETNSGRNASDTFQDPVHLENDDMVWDTTADHYQLACDDDFDNDQADLIDPEQGGQQPARSITNTIKEKTLNAVKIVGDVVNK